VLEKSEIAIILTLIIPVIIIILSAFNRVEKAGYKTLLAMLLGLSLAGFGKLLMMYFNM
jgi:hypothetical protein